MDNHHDTPDFSGEPPAELKPLVFGLLRKGPAWSPQASPDLKEDQRGHLANLQRLVAAGKLLLAGPIPDGEDLRGILLFNVESPPDARALMAADPHLQSGRLVLDLYPLLVDAAAIRRPLLPPTESEHSHHVGLSPSTG